MTSPGAQNSRPTTSGTSPSASVCELRRKWTWTTEISVAAKASASAHQGMCTDGTGTDNPTTWRYSATAAAASAAFSAQTAGTPRLSRTRPMRARSDRGSPFPSTHHEPPPHSMLVQRLLVQRLLVQRLLVQRLLVQRLLVQRLLVQRLLVQRLLVQRLLLRFSTAYWLRGAWRSQPPNGGRAGRTGGRAARAAADEAATSMHARALQRGVRYRSAGWAPERSSALTWSGRGPGRCGDQQRGGAGDDGGGLRGAGAAEAARRCGRPGRPRRGSEPGTRLGEDGDAGCHARRAGGWPSRGSRTAAMPSSARVGGAAGVRRAGGDHVGIVGGRVEAGGVGRRRCRRRRRRRRRSCQARSTAKASGSLR